MTYPIDTREGAWHVLVEESGKDYYRWSLMEERPIGPGLEEARQAAAHLAMTYQPRHPFSPKNRNVYQQGPDSWVVVVTGASKTFHFRVSVCRCISSTVLA